MCCLKYTIVSASNYEDRKMICRFVLMCSGMHQLQVVMISCKTSLFLFMDKYT